MCNSDFTFPEKNKNDPLLTKHNFVRTLLSWYLCSVWHYYSLKYIYCFYMQFILFFSSVAKYPSYVPLSDSLYTVDHKFHWQLCSSSWFSFLYYMSSPGNIIQSHSYHWKKKKYILLFHKSNFDHRTQISNCLLNSSTMMEKKQDRFKVSLNQIHFSHCYSQDFPPYTPDSCWPVN